MGWNNGRNYNNYNNRRYDRNYDDNRDYRANLHFSEGTKCTLTYNSNKKVVIIRKGREQYECRDLDTLHINWFYEHELVPVNE